MTIPPEMATPGEAPRDLGGDTDFRDIANQVGSVDRNKSRADLETFLLRHTHHHDRPKAVAMLAGVQLQMGDAAAAKRLIDNNPGLLQAQQAELLTGLCESGLGHHRRALDLLAKYIGADPPPVDGFPYPETKGMVRIALSASLASTGDVATAIDQLELYAAGADRNPDRDRGLAKQRAEELASGMSEAAALAGLSAKHGGLARAALGGKAAAALRARGDQAGALRIDQETVALRKQWGLARPEISDQPMDPYRLGLVIPLSGPQSRLGDTVVRGASLVVTAATHENEPAPPYRLVVRDAAAPAERTHWNAGAIAGVASLAREEKVVGIVGVADAPSLSFAAGDGVPVLVLDERVPGARTTAFPLIHSAEARVTALVRRALALGARRFAVLGPDNASGKRLSAIYKRAVEEGGGALTAQGTYPANSTSFSAQVASLRPFPFEALFIPDDASRLELIAPALAVANIWPRVPRILSASAREASSAGSGRRETLLLSTALGLSPKLLQTTERYVQGALLCPGFYPSDDSRNASFVGRFRELYGTMPTATDAYGYDGVFLLRGAVDRGAKTRADVLRLLSTQTFEGLTGDIRFGADHSRIDPPIVYVVEGDSIRILK